MKLYINNALTDTVDNFFFRELFALKVLHHCIIIGFNDLVDHLCTVFVGFSLHVFWNLNSIKSSAVVCLVDVSYHLDEVNNTLEVTLSTDRKLDGYTILGESLFDSIKINVEISTCTI